MHWSWTRHCAYSAETGMLGKLRLHSFAVHSINLYCSCFFYLVTKSCLTLQTDGLQQARLLCPSPSPRVCSSLCPLSWWFYLTILSSVIPFSFCLQSFPASGFFSSEAPQYWKVLELFRISPCNEYYRVDSFGVNWFDFHAVQRTLKINFWVPVKWKTPVLGIGCIMVNEKNVQNVSNIMKENMKWC